MIVIAAGITALIVIAWLSTPAVMRWANATVSVPYDRVRVATVSRGDLVRDVSVQGRVVAAVSPTLYASAAGTITLEVDAAGLVRHPDRDARALDRRPACGCRSRTARGQRAARNRDTLDLIRSGLKNLQGTSPPRSQGV